ncbi:hypothetical protein RUM43_005282, partial [Polyplax serrata]
KNLMLKRVGPLEGRDENTVTPKNKNPMFLFFQFLQLRFNPNKQTRRTPATP